MSKCWVDLVSIWRLNFSIFLCRNKKKSTITVELNSRELSTWPGNCHKVLLSNIAVIINSIIKGLELYKAHHNLLISACTVYSHDILKVLMLNWLRNGLGPSIGVGWSSIVNKLSSKKRSLRMPLSGYILWKGCQKVRRNFHPFLWTLLLVLLHLFSFIYLYTKTNVINQSKESDEAKQALRLLICFSLEAIRSNISNYELLTTFAAAWFGRYIAFRRLFPWISMNWINTEFCTLSTSLIYHNNLNQSV